MSSTSASPIDGANPGAATDAAVLRAAISIQHELAAAGLDLKAVMQRIADRTRELTGGSAAAVRLQEGDYLITGAVSGSPEIGMPERLPVGNNLAGHAMRSRRSLLCMDTETDPRVDSALARERNVRSIIAAPLYHASRSVGVLLLYGHDPAAFGDRDVTTIELLSVVLSAALAHAAEFEAKRDQVDALARFEATFAGALTGMLLVDLKGCILDGNVLWVDASASLVRDAEGRKSFMIAMIQDVTQRKKAEAALRAQAELNEHQALHDALTGLANRTLFHDRVDRAVKAASRGDVRVAVLMMDLDRFKEVNDSLGH